MFVLSGIVLDLFMFLFVYPSLFSSNCQLQSRAYFLMSLPPSPSFSLLTLFTLLSPCCHLLLSCLVFPSVAKLTGKYQPRQSVTILYVSCVDLLGWSFVLGTRKM